MKTKEEKLSYLSTRGAEVAQLLSVRNNRANELGERLLSKLEELAEELFPGDAESFRKNRVAESEARRARVAERGRKAWAKLHKRALKPVADEVAEQAWLVMFGEGLPCGECKAFYMDYMKRKPVWFGEFFKWTVELHNAVNQKLGKPVIELGSATALWRD